jgi:hypothetical protein
MCLAESAGTGLTQIHPVQAVLAAQSTRQGTVVAASAACAVPKMPCAKSDQRTEIHVLLYAADQ